MRTGDHKEMYSSCYTVYSLLTASLRYKTIPALLLCLHLLSLSAPATAAPATAAAPGATALPSNKTRVKVETEFQCKVYLCKYGYMNCDCTAYIKQQAKANGGRAKRDTSGSPPVIPMELDDAELKEQQIILPEVLAEPSRQTCNAAHFRQGYLDFQQVYRLQASGICDNKTKYFMSQSRCGQPDLFNTNEVRQATAQSDAPPFAGNGSSSNHSNDNNQTAQHHNSRRSSPLRRIVQQKNEMADVIERRKQIFQEFIDKQTGDHETYENGGSTRAKRSLLDINIAGPMNKDRISWRLMSSYTNPNLPVNMQNAVLMSAFRYWSEVSPLCFEEKKQAPQVDIEIGFMSGRHLTCTKDFDGYGGELAHEYKRDVHFDQAEPFVGVLPEMEDHSDKQLHTTSINLLLVAVHEIGHALGFNHSAVTTSVMNAIYHSYIKGHFEISSYDRAVARNTYGACRGRFDEVFDVISTSGRSRIFNTFFFRGEKFWMYENKNGRARYGDPLAIGSNWRGLPSHIDAFAQYFEQRGYVFIDEYYFFKGNTYYQYDWAKKTVIQHGSINDKFHAGAHGSIPTSFDTVFYEFLTKKFLFFKGDTVWQYRYRSYGNHSCCTEPSRPIVSLIRPKSSSDLVSPDGDTYARDLDSVYLSWTSPFPLYLIKGNSAWLVEGYSVYGPYRPHSLRAKYVGRWNTIWNYICDVEC